MQIHRAAFESCTIACYCDACTNLESFLIIQMTCKTAGTACSQESGSLGTTTRTGEDSRVSSACVPRWPDTSQLQPCTVPCLSWKALLRGNFPKLVHSSVLMEL